MSVERPAGRVVMFVESDSEECAQVIHLIQDWNRNQPGTVVTIVSVLEEPEEIIRLGIEKAPALVMDGKLVAQAVSAEGLARLLETNFNNEEKHLRHKKE